MPKFYPRVSKLISSDRLPAYFSEVSNVFDKLYFRNFQTVKSLDGVTVSYVIELISYKELKIEIAGSGFSLLLNPDFESDGYSAFPLSFSTRWGIRKYIKNFNISSRGWCCHQPHQEKPTEYPYLKPALSQNFKNQHKMVKTIVNIFVYIHSPRFKPWAMMKMNKQKTFERF